LASNAWTNGLQVYSYDVIDEGAEAVIRGVKLAGANTVVLMVNANEVAPIATPHNPARQVNWGESFVPHTLERYPSALQPSRSDAPQSDGRAAYQALYAEGQREGVLVVPWTQILRTPIGADDRNRCVDVRGQTVGEWLCPNGPDTLNYVAALALDCVEQLDAPALFLDRIRFPALGGTVPEGLYEALACFCDGCCDQARAEGLDLEHVRTVLLRRVEWILHEPTATGAAATQTFSSVMGGIRALAAEPDLLQFLRFRQRSVRRLVSRVRNTLPARTELWLDVWQPTEAWLLGQDLEQLAPFASWVKPFFYHQIVTWSIPKLIKGITADPSERLALYKAYLNLFGYSGPDDFDVFADRGLLPSSITSEMRLAKKMLGNHARLAAGVGIWDVGVDGVRDALESAAKAEPDGIWMHCYGWATMDELAAAGEWLREHGMASGPRTQP
jgi:hypothetical protein